MRTGSDRKIIEGEFLTKNELKSRLNQMEIEFDNYIQRKNYYVELYDKAINVPVNRKKIEDKLHKDEQDMNEKRRKRPRDISEDATIDLKIEAKQAKSLRDRAESLPTQNMNVKKMTDIDISDRMEEGLIFHEKSAANTNIEVLNINKIAEKEENVHHQPLIKNESPIRVGVTTTKISLSKPISSTSSTSNVSSSTSNIKLSKVDAVKQLTYMKMIPEANTNFHYLPQIQTSIQVPPSFPQPLVYLEQPNQYNIKLPLQASYATGSFICPVNDSVNDINNDYNLRNHINSKSKMSSFELRPNEANNVTFNNNLRTRQHSHSNSSTYLLNSKNISQTTLPIDTEGKFKRAQNEVIRREFESIIKPITLPNSNKDIIRVENPTKINGAVLIQESSKTSAPSLKTNPKLSTMKINGLDKWEHPDKNIVEIKILAKYFVTGIACSVLIFGFYYCIQNCSSFTFESLGFKQKIPSIIKPDLIPDSGKETTTSRAINKGFDYSPGRNIPGSEIPQVEAPSFSDKLKEFFSPINSIYWALTNPKEFFWKIIYDGLKYLAFEIAWSYFKRHLWYFLGMLTLKLIVYKAYGIYKNKSLSHSIFRDIKQRLRTICAAKNYDGISEDEIVKDYSKDYELKEDYFKNNIMPYLKKMRQKDAEIREFETCVNGRNRISWEYVGYG